MFCRLLSQFNTPEQKNVAVTLGKKKKRPRVYNQSKHFVFYSKHLLYYYYATKKFNSASH
jgi:hypothetical protein